MSGVMTYEKQNPIHNQTQRDPRIEGKWVRAETHAGGGKEIQPDGDADCV